MSVLLACCPSRTVARSAGDSQDIVVNGGVIDVSERNEVRTVHIVDCNLTVNAIGEEGGALNVSDGDSLTGMVERTLLSL